MFDLYSGYGVRITPSGGSATLIGGVENQSLPVDTDHKATPTAGNPYASHGQITRIQPRGLFSSLQLNALLPILGLRGACLAGGALPGFEMFQLALERCGAVKTGSVHRKLTIPNGLVVARSISVSHRQSAVMNCEVLSVFDGTNDPVIAAENQAAPTGLAHTHEFTLGPVTLAGQLIEGNLSLEIDYQNQSETDGGDSDPFDTHIHVPQVIPTLSIRTRNVAKLLNEVPLRGLHGTHANTSIVLRRYVNGTASFSDDADNIRLTFDGMINADDVFNAQANRRAEGSIKLTALDDGTNAPLVADVAYDPTP